MGLFRIAGLICASALMLASPTVVAAAPTVVAAAPQNDSYTEHIAVLPANHDSISTVSPAKRSARSAHPAPLARLPTSLFVLDDASQDFRSPSAAAPFDPG